MILYRHNYVALAFVPKPRKRKPILSLRPGRRPSKRFRPLDAPIRTTRPALDLLPRIDLLIIAHGLNDTRIGRDAASDPNLVHDIRGGRRLRDATRGRLVAYLDRVEQGGR